jgi:transcriptional regulator with XRE-family HTH domain
MASKAEQPTNKPSPTVRRRELGRELRRLREAAKLRREDAAEYIDLSVPSVSKIETGKQAVTVPAVRALLQLYGVGSPLADHLVNLAKQANMRGWWVTFGDTVPDFFRTFVGLESDAAEEWTYESESIPGLFQTPEYTKAVRYAFEPTASDADLERSVALRAARQERLTADNPLRVHAIVNEGALWRQVGGPDAMRRQLQHLESVAARDNVTIQVLPFSAGAHPAMVSSFSMLRFPEESMSTVYVEFDRGAVYPERKPDVDHYVDKFERVKAVALGREESIEKIARVGDDLQKGAGSR